MGNKSTAHLKAFTDHFWQKGDLSYKLDSLQLQINFTVLSHYSVAKEICVLSARQIGKSYWVLCFALGFIIRNPRCIVRLLAPTNKKAQEIIEDNLFSIIADCPQGLIDTDRGRRRWTCRNGSSLRIGALEAQYVDDNRSGNARLVIYEECGFVPGNDFNYARRSVLGPQLVRSNGHEIFVSSPSRDPLHPLHNIIMPTCEHLGTLFRYTVYDSPSLTPSQINQAMERAGGEGSEDWQREYLAMIIRSPSLMVVPNWNEKKTMGNFVIEPLFRHRLTMTADWGGVRDKTVVLLHWYEPNNDIDYVLDELVFKPNTPTSVMEPFLSKWIKDYQIDHFYADVPGQLQIDLSTQFKLRVSVPPKNDWQASVNTLSARFSLDKMRIDHKCTFLKRSILGGRFNKTRTDFVRDEGPDGDVKERYTLGHMDALAALCYSIRTARYAGAANTKKDITAMKAQEKIAATTKTFGPFRRSEHGIY